MSHVDMGQLSPNLVNSKPRSSSLNRLPQIRILSPASPNNFLKMNYDRERASSTGNLEEALMNESERVVNEANVTFAVGDIKYEHLNGMEMDDSTSLDGDADVSAMPDDNLDSNLISLHRDSSRQSIHCGKGTPPRNIVVVEKNVSDSSSPKGDTDNPHSRSSSPKGRLADRKSVTGGVSGIQRAASAIKTFLAPNYKSRNEEYRKLFKSLPESEKFVIDYSCAFQREILVHGRMYASQHSICFYANIFGWETNLIIKFKDISTMTKERTAKVIPNAIQLVTVCGEKYFLTSFASRDKSFNMIFRLWQCCLVDQVVSPQDMWVWAQHGYTDADIEDNEQDDNHNIDIAQDLSGIDSVSKSPAMKGVSSWMKLNAEKENRSPDSTTQTPHVAASPPYSPPVSPDESNVINETLSTVRRRRKPAVLLMQTPPTPSSFMGLDTVDDSSETDGDICCPCKDHPGQCLMNQVYPVSVDQLFLLLFTDGEFNKKFLDHRKTTDMVCSDWTVDQSTKSKEREMTYTVSLNHSMGPKTAQVQEKQTVFHHGDNGHVYVIKSEAINQGIPYADSFNVESTFCLTRVSANEGRIQCHGNVAFKKNVWGIVKSFIEKNTYAAMLEHFNELDMMLKKECDKLGLPVSSFPDTSAVDPASRRRRISELRDPCNAASLRRNQPSIPNPLNIRMDFAIKALILLLILMLFVNAVLLYKLWGVQNSPTSHNLYGYSIDELKLFLNKAEASESEASKILALHAEFARSKWLDSLQGAIHKLAALETQMKELKSHITNAQIDYDSYFAKQ